VRNESDLTGQLLIAMPDIGDPRFQRSVILICEHSKDGTMGLILNKPSSDVSFEDLAKQLELGTPVGKQQVYFGGPVEMGRGFVLHSSEYVSGRSSHLVLEGLRLSTSLDVLEDMVTGTGPRAALLMLGYAGWGAGQLEGEILANGWLSGPADAEFVLGGGGTEMWSAALKRLGVTPLHLSATAGHA
jgi:putative transcriptional regulator